jgi:hypothetical protein
MFDSSFCSGVCGCVNSPENPTAILLLIGALAVLYLVLWRRCRWKGRICLVTGMLILLGFALGALGQGKQPASVVRSPKTTSQRPKTSGKLICSHGSCWVLPSKRVRRVRRHKLIQPLV